MPKFGYDVRMYLNLPIKKKFILLLATIALLGTLVGGVIIERTISNLMKRSNTSLAIEIAKIEKERISSAFRNDINMARLISKDLSIAGWLAQEEDPLLREQAMTLIDNYAENSASGRFFYIVDQSKNYYTNSDGVGIAHSRYVYTLDVADPSAAWYLEATQTDREYLLNLDSDEVVGDMVSVYVNYPVRDSDGQVVALTGTATPVQNFVDRYARNDDFSAVNIILDADGKVLIQHGDFYLDSASAQKSGHQARQRLSDNLVNPVEAAKLQESLALLKGNDQFVDSFTLTLDARPWIAAITYIESLDWYAVSMVQKSKSLASTVFYISYGVFTGVFVVVLILFWFVLDRIIVHRLIDLQELAIRIYQRSKISKVQTGGDELTSLKQGMTQMQNKIHQQIFELESTVKKRTLELEQKNQELLTLSVRDSLTGLLNRRGLMHQFSIEYRRAQRENRQIGLALLDVDDFKILNDHYGHKVGDLALEAIADAIQNRSDDVYARWGGEEFVIIYQAVTEEKLHLLLTRLQESIAAVSLQTEQGEISLTASIGCILIQPELAIAENDKQLQDTLSSYIDNADQVMYMVKQSGKAGFRVETAH